MLNSRSAYHWVTMTQTTLFGFGLPPWFYVVAAALAVMLLALAVHRAGAAVLRRVTRSRVIGRLLVNFTYQASRYALLLIALQIVWSAADDALPGIRTLRHLTGLGLIAMLTWLAIRASHAVSAALIELHPANIDNNLDARRVQTQTHVLGRCVNFVIVLIGVSAALMTFPGVRQIGTSLLASAGVAGLVAGIAARPVLGNLIAGLQIALTQPIRIDDVLIVQGEWGRVEEITGTYVVVRLWDERRLIVPLQWFIENPFQNWTRTTSQIIGTVYLWVDYGMPLEPLRAELKRLCQGAPEWDGRLSLLQVTDSNERSMQLRALVTAADSGRNWDLRCKVREGLVSFVRRHYPDYLPRVRATLDGPDEPHGRGEPRDAQ